MSLQPTQTLMKTPSTPLQFPDQDLTLMNQALGQLTVTGIQNQEKIIDNVALLFDAVRELQAHVQSRDSELLLMKELLTTAQQQKLETAKIFEAYKKASNELIATLSTKVDTQADELKKANVQIQQLRTDLTILDKRYSGHTHIIGSHNCQAQWVPTYSHKPIDGARK
jgi:hypothetical protein